MTRFGWPPDAPVMVRPAQTFAMTPEPSIFGFFLTIGVVFGGLASLGAYVIALNEYRQRMLRLDQNPRRMAMQVAATTFVFMVAASVVLYFALRPK
jgi:hypothetical protein